PAECTFIASSQLKRYIDELRTPGGSDVSVVRVQIDGPSLVKTGEKRGLADGNFMQLLGLLTNELPAFYMLRQDPTKWYLITWMPEGKVPIKDRMVYASSQSALKEAIGYPTIAGTFQFGKEADITGIDKEGTAAPSSKVSGQKQIIMVGLNYTARGVFRSEMDPRLAMSDHELTRLEMLHDEDEAREEQMSQIRAHIKRFGLTTPSMATTDDYSANHHINNNKTKITEAAQSGGFHSVVLPFTQAAKDALRLFSGHTSDTTSVELVVRDSAEVDVGEITRKPLATANSSFANPNEPRFYIVRIPSGIQSGSRVFVYCCPESSAPRLRMVYSTAAQGVLSNAQNLGCGLEYKISVYSAKDTTLDAISRAVADGSAQRLSDSKSVEKVVGYRPVKPAQSVPARFMYSAAKPLVGFTNEEGFRRAFNNISPAASPSGGNTPHGISPASSFKGADKAWSKPISPVANSAATSLATPTTADRVAVLTDSYEKPRLSEKKSTSPSAPTVADSAPGSSELPKIPSKPLFGVISTVSSSSAPLSSSAAPSLAKPAGDKAASPPPKPVRVGVNIAAAPVPEKPPRLHGPSVAPQKPSKPATLPRPLTAAGSVQTETNYNTTDEINRDYQTARLQSTVSYLKSELTYPVKDAPKTAAAIDDPWSIRTPVEAASNNKPTGDGKPAKAELSKGDFDTATAAATATVREGAVVAQWEGPRKVSGVKEDNFAATLKSKALSASPIPSGVNKAKLATAAMHEDGVQWRSEVVRLEK
ncbi:Twinfilin-1, partial [Spiromyces aspiralis]